MKPSLKQLIIIGLIISGVVINRYFGITDYLTWDWFLEHRELLQDYVNQHYAKSVLAYIAFYIFTSAFALPGTFIVTLAGGFLFGYFPGILFVNVAATVGASCAFLASRYLLGQRFQQRYHERLVQLNSELDRYGFYYMIVLRLLIVAPFFVVNVLAGLTRIPLRTFMWTTSLGIIPISSIYLIAGQQLGLADRPAEIFSWPLVVSFTLLTLLLLVPMYYRKRSA